MNPARLFLTIVLLLTFSSAALAEECPAPDNKVHAWFEAGGMFGSRYQCDDSGGFPYNGAVFQAYSKISLDYKGFEVYAKYWDSWPIAPDGIHKGANERDPIIAGLVAPVGPFRIGLGYGFYDLYGHGDLHGVFGSISYLNKFVNISLNVECDIPTAKKILQGGWYYRLTANHCFPLAKNLSLIPSVSIGGNDGAFGTRVDFFSYTRAALTLEWEPWKNFVLAPQVSYQMRMGHNPNQNGLNADGITAGMMARWRFNIF